MRIVESLQMVESVEDWSNVRSPSRAERRRRQGKRQNIVVQLIPRKDAISIDGGKTYLVHPEVARELRRTMAQFQDKWRGPTALRGI
ncbi:MAG: hypothetical protein AB7R40_23710 [Nitrospiraceae bacterium]